jgi:hypothetical protein
MIDGAALRASVKRSRTHADDHLDELRAAHTKERDIGLASHGARQQGLAGARWANQQHTSGHSPTQPLVCVRMFQEIDDLDQIVLGLIDAGNIGEGDRMGIVGCLIAAGATAAEGEEPAAGGACGTPAEPQKSAHEQDRRAEREQQRKPGRARFFQRLGRDHHAGTIEQWQNGGVGSEGWALCCELGRGLWACTSSLSRVLHGALERPLNGLSAAGDRRDVAVGDLLLEECVGHCNAVLRLWEK